MRSRSAEPYLKDMYVDVLKTPIQYLVILLLKMTKKFEREPNTDFFQAFAEP